ncbi:hypothetical protein EJB05_55517 [Eragrostis curvula]|nr:hypothetical protein EJB05_55517 [Eragrostis curvula]
MKSNRRRKAMESAQPQILKTPRKENPDGRKAWLPKSIKYDFGVVGDFTEDGLKYFESVSGVRRSVVSLFCTVGENESCCSGTVVDHDLKKTWILTSGCLARKPDTQFEAYARGTKIKVSLPNEQIVEGSLEMCNLHYNIAIVTIESPESLFDLPAVGLSDLPECYTLQPRPVVALGRDVFSKDFLMRYGVLVRKSSDLGCKELLVSTCDVSPHFIGGPVMDHEKRFIGITFPYQDAALVLPVEIAARCLKYCKKERTLPWLRIKGLALHTLAVEVLESICCKFARPPSGVLVDRICDISTEKYGGMEVGDIITELDGVTVYSIAQFTSMFIDKMEAARGALNTVIVKAVVQRHRDKTTFVANLNVQEIASVVYDKTFQNRWMHYKSYGLGEDFY